ncbi:MAG: LuxR C-terminal-related transcriptional regulator, partial [Ktedonobacteraceae bacterium]
MSAMLHEMTLLITTESLGFGTFVVDDGHRIVSWNEAATRTLGYGADDTLGRTCEEILTLLDAQDIPVCPDSGEIADITDALCTAHMPAVDLHSLRHQQPEPVQLRVVTRHGAIRWLSLSILHARKLDGTACVVHIFRDVTEQTERQRRSEVAAQVAHHPGIVLRLSLRASETADSDHEMKVAPERLTPREHEVLELLAQGMATIEIATALGISRVTARNHVTRVIEKLGVKTRLQAVLA